MGTGISSSYLGNHYLSFLENKKITTLKPVYLVFWKDKRFNSYSTKEDKPELTFNNYGYSTCNYNNQCSKGMCVKCKSIFSIKINAKLTFYIKDIIGYDRVFDESGNIYYDVMPIFLNNTHKIRLSDIEFIKVPIEYLNQFRQQPYLDISNAFFREYFFQFIDIKSWESNEETESKSKFKKYFLVE